MSTEPIEPPLPRNFLRPAILLCSIFSVIGSFQLFAEPQIFYAIAPTVIGKAYTPNLYVYNLAFADQQLNYAAALSFMLGVVVFVVSSAGMGPGSRHYSDDFFDARGEV